MYSTRISILLILTVASLTLLEGPQIIDLTASTLDTVMSEDGSIIVNTYWTHNDAEVFVKSKSGFVLNQSLPNSNGATDVSISANNSILLSVNTDSIKYYVRGTDGLYSDTQTFSQASFVNDAQICASEEFMAVTSSTNYLRIYRKNSGAYSLHSTESCLTGFPLRIAFSHDCQWMAWACSSGDINIFLNMSLLQILAFGHITTSMAISNSTLLITTVPSPIFAYSYRYNGSQFLL